MKDKNNVLTYNQWSGTDYLNNTTEFIRSSGNVLIELSNEWSVNGENSLKITKLLTSSYWIQARYYSTIINEELTGKLTIKTKQSNVRIYLVEILNSSFINSNSVTIPNNTVAPVEILLNSGENNTAFALHVEILGDINNTCFIDNLELFVG